MHSLLWILGLVSVLLVASSIGRLFVQEGPPSEERRHSRGAGAGRRCVERPSFFKWNTPGSGVCDRSGCMVKSLQTLASFSVWESLAMFHLHNFSVELQSPFRSATMAKNTVTPRFRAAILHDQPADSCVEGK
jgi:hypothetical protein